MKSLIGSIFLIAVLATVPALGDKLPPLVVPEGVGVNIHFVTGHKRDLDMIARAGFKWIRMDFGWAATERKRGQYDWSGYDQLTDELEQRGLRAYYILDYSNPLYEKTVVSRDPVSGKTRRDLASPRHPESVAAFARWAAAAAAHFKGRGIVWEIWNEPNIGFWKPKPDVHQYTRLALATCKAIRRADPEAIIVAPTTSTFPWKFLRAFFQSGVLAYLNAVSVHPYRGPHRPPETAAADFKRLKSLIAEYMPSAARKPVPILSGEWGYSSNTRGVSLKTQADFIARQQLSNLLNGVRISIWYDWCNDGTDPAENEQNFGTVTASLHPKPAYTAIRTLTRQLSGYHVARRLDGPDPGDFLLLFRNHEGDQRLAAWTTGDAHGVQVQIRPAHGIPVVAVRNDGSSFRPDFDGSQVRLSLSGSPIYVTLPRTPVLRVRPAFSEPK